MLQGTYNARQATPSLQRWVLRKFSISQTGPFFFFFFLSFFILCLICMICMIYDRSCCHVEAVYTYNCMIYCIYIERAHVSWVGSVLDTDPARDPVTAGCGLHNGRIGSIWSIWSINRYLVVYPTRERVMTVLGLQPRFGDTPLNFQVTCPQEAGRPGGSSG